MSNSHHILHIMMKFDWYDYYIYYTITPIKLDFKTGFLFDHA